ncbi:hypothetical protein ABB37_04260 [Leptomonas pyrrhocoris]|uniref:Transmembrane protein n=1 Tax=Leptomonas pyrrhocoris TaxID=157538 RepID=A0A0N0DVT7_LEPPY|nr:hypothetical protein ABB37_04260 [Leptomonas pyrrhocoris]XP_015659273.1 hypothetical protein ABB37_04260 [Leptomonas pyrrhocoris]KPA80833.1 hypothetical protein ABB37_04260 [Leptomonas pyrrhocoris]KPA80834.1 hypothetical protein ABB37_04260 [Leptomonas pyrrhocoris]|eukprot:XP_015659272.1 hypothetical protein ABB37_04260 [Leptomonas pyrrhocoris]
MLEQSIMSRSPSGQWYPQQQQLPYASPQAYGNVAGHPPGASQWSPMSGNAASTMSPGGANATLGNSGLFNSTSGNFWSANPGAVQGGGVGASVQADGSRCNSSAPAAAALTPQQLMMQQRMMPGQDQCCATCCGPTSGCCGPTSGCCGPTGGCCGPTGGCCPVPGEPVDPFCCAAPMLGQEAPCYVTIYNCFDWTFLLACLLFIATVVGFAVVVATKQRDDIFKKFDARNTTELDAAMKPYIIWMNGNSTNHTDSGSSSSVDSSRSSRSSGSSGSTTITTTVKPPALVVMDQLAPVVQSVTSAVADAVLMAAARDSTAHNCTQRKLLGSFGVLCMEDSMYANTFAVQLSSWTNARDTLWFLAMVYSGFTLLYALLINAQRHPSGGVGMAGANALPTISPQEQEEFMKMTPQQQQAFMMEYQQRVASVQQQNPQVGFTQPPGSGCCGSDSGVEFYDTPFYEFVRLAWFVSGLTAFVWTCNLFISFWAFSNFYIQNTSGPLRVFWSDYTRKMNGSLVMVTVFLAWPLCSFALDLVLWLIGVLPWLVIRSTCKRGVEMYRPALPLSQLPMYIRADMFFLDFQDVKRLGFSRQAWMMLTGSDRPFMDCCEDPTVDKDPAMTQLMQMRLQWQQSMMSMIPPWMQQAGMGAGTPMNYQQQQQQMMAMMGAAGGGAESARSHSGTPATVATNGALLIPANSSSASPAEYPVEEAEMKTHRRRRRSTRDNLRHRDPASANVGAGATPNSNGQGMEQTSLGMPAANNGGAAANSSRHRRRHRSKSRSRSKAAFESGAATPVPPGSDAAVAASAGGNSPGATLRHRRRHSHSKEAGAARGASPMPPVPPPIPAPPADEGESGGGHHRRHSRSRSRSNAAGAGEAAAAAAGGGGGADTQHRHRRHSHSRSREKQSGKAAAAKDLDALLQL